MNWPLLIFHVNYPTKTSAKTRRDSRIKCYPAIWFSIRDLSTILSLTQVQETAPKSRVATECGCAIRQQRFCEADVGIGTTLGENPLHYTTLSVQSTNLLLQHATRIGSMLDHRMRENSRSTWRLNRSSLLPVEGQLYCPVDCRLGRKSEIKDAEASIKRSCLTADDAPS
jgi:hypothetical protein